MYFDIENYEENNMEKFEAIIAVSKTHIPFLIESRPNDLINILSDSYLYEEITEGFKDTIPSEEGVYHCYIVINENNDVWIESSHKVDLI